MIKPEKKLQDKAIQYLKDKGIYELNLYGDGMSGKGKPDLVVCINGLFVAFELKVGENGLSDAQKIHRKRIRRSGGLYYTPYTFIVFKGIVDTLLMGISVKEVDYE